MTSVASAIRQSSCCEPRPVLPLAIIDKGSVLYQAYQNFVGMMLPLQMAAAATARQVYPTWPGMPDPGVMRYLAAGCELMAQAQLTHHRPAFGIDTITVGGRSVAVREEVVKTMPFCTLVHFAKEV